MKQFFILTVILAGLALASCSKDKDKEQSEKLPASIIKLMEEETCTCKPYINLYTWNGLELYVLAYKSPGCNWMPTYFNKKGETVEMPQGYTYSDFISESKLVKPVWDCPGKPVFQI